MTTTAATEITEITEDTIAAVRAAAAMVPDEPALAPNVIVALSRVMAELPNIGRDMESPQGYNYRGIEQITRHAQPLFAKHGIVLAPHHVEWQAVTELTINGRPWTDEKLLVTYRCYGPGGSDDFIVIEVPGIGRDNADKGSNKAMTQAYKYALIQALCVADGKDDADSHDVPGADAAYDPTTAPARPEQLARIRELCQTLRDRGTEVTETNDLKEVTVLGVQLLERRDDGKLYAAVKAQGADDLIGTLNAKLADALLGDQEPAAAPPPEPVEPPAPLPPPDTGPEAHTAAEREETERERVAREQLLAVKSTPAKKAK